ncbi:hypothetical protein KCU81_g6896, partial [Aureobasidium melanogenum]
MITRDSNAPAFRLPDDALLIDLDNEPDHYNFADSDQEEVKVKIESTPETNTTVDLGDSILQPKQAVSDLDSMTADELHAFQQSLYSQYMAPQHNEEDQQNYSEPEEDIENPLAFESGFLQDQKKYLEKKRKGKITPDEELHFMRKESAYTKKKRHFQALLDEIEDPLFEPEAPKKRARTSKSQSKAKTSRKRKGEHVNLDQGDLFEDAEAAANMAEEPTFEASNRREDALKALRGDAPRGSAAAIDSRRVNQAIKNFIGRETVKPAANGHWSVRGMHTSLKNYQIINSGFMRGRENGLEKPRGGIIADQMGLGKTLTCLTNIVNGRPRQGEGPDNRYSTLIVVPNALLDQWEEQISTHCVVEETRTEWGIGRVKVYRENMSKGWRHEDFENIDIVLTTYHDVMLSWPKFEWPEGLPEDQREEYFQEEVYPKRGPLHQYRWLRIVLDEGHKIRTPTARTTEACIQLIAHFRWVLTGTTMVNGAHDLYSLFSFIRHPTVKHMDFESFKTTFCNERDLMSWDLLTDDLLKTMARFTHNQSLFGRRLVTLPKSRSRKLKLEFSPVEKAIYNVVHYRCKHRANIFSEDGESSTACMNILALITLLRQMTAHPLMLQSKISDMLEPEDFDKLEKVIEDEMSLGDTGKAALQNLRAIVQVGRTKAQTRAEDPTQNYINPTPNIDNLDEGEDDMQELDLSAIDHETFNENDTGGPHGKNVDYAAFLTKLKSSTNPEVMKQRIKCSYCGRPALLPKVAPCGHYYCTSHLDDLFHATTAKGLKRVKCVQEMGNGKKCGQKLNKNADVEATDTPKWSLNKTILPSTKTIAFKAQVMAWLDEYSGDPSAKIIVFTQWVSFLRILGCICESEKWGYKTLHGKLSHKQRGANIAAFKTNPDVRILLATMKTGGQGLNLTEARYVLLVDPYWNDAGEQQSFARVLRIGQTKETEFVSLIIRKSIDKKLQDIKKRKTAEISMVNKKYTTKKQRLLEMLEDPDSEDEDEGSASE